MWSGRGAQTSAMRLKAAGSMPMLGLMPSGEPRPAWATWLQDLVTHRGHVAADLACLDEHPCPGRSRPSFEAPSGRAHSHMSTECAQHLSGDAATGRASRARKRLKRQGSVGARRAPTRFFNHLY